MFEDLAKVFDPYSNDSDKLSFTQISDVRQNRICRQHQLPAKTEIYYFRESSSSETYAISELGISQNIYGDVVLFEWSLISNVEYDSDESQFVIYYGDEIITIGSYTLLKWSTD
jgi:hypothetical protein